VVVCEYCGCELDSDGQILRRGERAKKFVQLEQTIDDLTVARDRAIRERDEARAQLATLQPAQPAAGGRKKIDYPF
jgi:hypothetical protein